MYVQGESLLIKGRANIHVAHRLNLKYLQTAMLCNVRVVVQRAVDVHLLDKSGRFQSLGCIVNVKAASTHFLQCCALAGESTMWIFKYPPSWIMRPAKSAAPGRRDCIR
jgi:hypothetical protein